MYRSFFELTDLPFRSTPDLEFFYKDADRAEVVSAILYALDRGDGIVKVVGEVGSGKTTLLRRLTQELSDEFSCVYINSPNLSPQDILFFICHEFGIDANPNDQKFFLTQKLHQYLLTQHANGKRPLLLVDEAQAMPIETLEEIRLLTNLETDQDKLLQIVLFGQPELDINLSKPEIRQFLSRISHSISLQPFSREDVQSYLNFRMRKAGYQGLDLFTPKVSNLIYKRSKGLPRDIHTLADSALLAAYSQGDNKILPKHILSSNKSYSWKWLSFVFGMLLILTLVIFSFNHAFLIQASSSTSAAANDTGLSPVQIQADTGQKSHETPPPDIKPEVNTPSETYLSVETFISNIEQKPHARYSIQLMIGELVDLENTLAVVEKSSQIDAHQVFWSINLTRQQFTLYYGLYEGYSLAKHDMSLLPSVFKSGSPFIASKQQVLTQLDASLRALKQQETF